MAFVDADGVRLYVEEHGEGTPIVFVHEFSGDYRSWAQQVGYFSRRYRCVTFNARGYPPSDVPGEESDYTQQGAVEDILVVTKQLGIDSAHFVGLSMGAFSVLHFGLQHPDVARSLTIAGCGYGVARDPEVVTRWEKDVAAMAAEFKEDAKAAAGIHSSAAGRLPFKKKDPSGWKAFADQLAEHSPLGAAFTLLGVQQKRPNIYSMEAELAELRVPTLVLHGDEDDPCLEPGLYLKRVMPSAGWCVLPKTGHTINLEEPAMFNRIVQEFVSTVDSKRWEVRAVPSGRDTLGIATSTGFDR